MALDPRPQAPSPGTGEWSTSPLRADFQRFCGNEPRWFSKLDILEAPFSDSGLNICWCLVWGSNLLLLREKLWVSSSPLTMVMTLGEGGGFMAGPIPSLSYLLPCGVSFLGWRCRSCPASFYVFFSEEIVSHEAVDSGRLQEEGPPGPVYVSILNRNRDGLSNVGGNKSASNL